MKTYSQKQIDSAKKKAYKKGIDTVTIPSNYEAFEKLVKGFISEELRIIELQNDSLENAQQVNSWKKWEQFDFDLTVTLLVVACVGAILMMIF